LHLIKTVGAAVGVLGADVVGVAPGDDGQLRKLSMVQKCGWIRSHDPYAIPLNHTALEMQVLSEVSSEIHKY
jgi:hypothetical protein